MCGAAGVGTVLHYIVGLTYLAADHHSIVESVIWGLLKPSSDFHYNSTAQIIPALSEAGGNDFFLKGRKLSYSITLFN